MIEQPGKICIYLKIVQKIIKKLHTSGCHNNSIPLAGSDLGIIRLLGFSLGETTWISFFFLLAPKQPKFSAETKKNNIKYTVFILNSFN